MDGRAGFGRTYGATVEAAVEAAARGGVIGRVGFDSNEDAVGAVVSFERLRRVLARHVRLLVGPAWPNEPGGHDLVADELARALEAAVRPVVSGTLQEFAGRHPAERAWRTSADALGLAHDILASHLDPDRAPLTPDGELALRPEAAWPALVRLADLALTLDRQRDCLVRRLVDAARARTLSGLPSVHVARLGTARVQRAAAKVIDAGQSRPGWLALDELAPAPLKSAILLPEDPLERALALADALRRFAYDQSRDGGTLGVDGLRSYATLGADITCHAAAVLRAGHDHRTVALAAQHGHDIRPVIQSTITSLQSASRTWSVVYQSWNDIASARPSPSRLHFDVLQTRRALAAVRRDRAGPWAVFGAGPDTGELLDAVDAASRLVGHLGTLGRHLQAIATRAHVTGQLLTPTRGLPEAELALLPWHRRYAPLPDSAFPPIARAYVVAEHASVDAASALGVASSALRMSVHVAQAHRSVSLDQAGSAGRRVAGAGPGEVGDGPMRRGPDLSL